jgi:hypothetical protein
MKVLFFLILFRVKYNDGVHLKINFELSPLEKLSTHFGRFGFQMDDLTIDFIHRLKGSSYFGKYRNEVVYNDRTNFYLREAPYVTFDMLNKVNLESDNF